MSTHSLLNNPFKIVLVGDSGVGKSSLLSRFTSDSYDPSIIATIGVTFGVRTVNLDNQAAKLQIWDTAGLERFRTIISGYMRSTHLIVVVYDVNNWSSFDNVRNWFQEVERHAPKDVLRLMIGNKADTPDKRAVAYIVAEELAKQRNVPFFETSARDGSEVERAFMTAVRLIKDGRDKANSKLTIPTAPTVPVRSWSSLLQNAQNFGNRSSSTPATAPSVPTAALHTLDGADRGVSHTVSNSDQEATSKTVRDLESDKRRLELSLRVVHALLEDTLSHYFIPTHPLVEEFLTAAKECTNVLAKSVVVRPSDAFLAELEVARKDTVALVGNSMIAILDEQAHSSVSVAGSMAPSVLVRVVSQTSLINACLNHIIRRTDTVNLSAETIASIQYTILQKIANVLKVASWAIPDSTSRNTFERSLGSLIEAANRLKLVSSQNPGLLDTTVLAPNFALLSALRTALAEEVKGEVRQESSLKSLLGFLSPK